MSSIPNPFGKDDYVQEGVNPSAGVLLLACTVGDDYDNPKNRIILWKDDSSFEFGSSGEAVLSIDATDDGNAFVLGENGTVIQFRWKGVTTQEELRSSRSLIINDAVVNIGPLRRLRLVGRDILCVGSVGQVYQLRDGRFEALPRLKIGGIEPTIEDVAGSDATNFLAVTSDGLGAKFGSSGWQDLDLPSNTKLSSICAMAGGGYGIAGSNGTLITGQPDRWQLVESTNLERHYWGVAWLNGLLYAAHLSGIDVLSDGELTPITLPVRPALEFTVLRTGVDGIWSFAGQTVGLLKGTEWQTFLSGRN